MWKCKKCNEEVDDDLNICWSCSYDKDGNIYTEEVKQQEMKEDNESDNESDKYSVLRFVATIYNIIGMVLGLIVFIGGLIVVFNTNSAVDAGIGLIITLIGSPIIYYSFKVISEIIMLFVNIADDVSIIRKHTQN